MKKQVFWHPGAFVEKFFTGDRNWGNIRLVSAGMVTGALILAGYLVHGGFRLGLTGLFSTVMLRSMVFPLAALMGAMLLAANYVRDIYELPRLRLGFRYLFASVFSLFHPRLWIIQGKKHVKEGDVNLLDTIGGPGYVMVSGGSVVLLERMNAPSNVYGMGIHYVTRLERVKQIGSLEDQHGFIEAMSATTKDGIPVVIRDVHYRYRLRTGRRYGDYMRRTPANPYPFSVHAMRNMTYGRIVRATGQVSWADAVRFAIDSIVTTYVQSHQIDHLTAPGYKEKDPREAVRKQLFAKGARQRLRNVGAELLWVDIGHFDIAEETVNDQRVETWQAKWTGSAGVMRAYGEARRLAYQELGRAEAQAEMLMSILLALEDVDMADNPAENLRNLILMRTAQILEAMSEQDQTESISQFPSPDSNPFH